MVTTRSREKRRHTALVLAEDLSTGEILRCDVIVDVIEQLGVLTTTRELFLEEAPETFELWAQDSQGNIRDFCFFFFCVGFGNSMVYFICIDRQRIHHPRGSRVQLAHSIPESG